MGALLHLLRRLHAEAHVRDLTHRVALAELLLHHLAIDANQSIKQNLNQLAAFASLSSWLGVGHCSRIFFCRKQLRIFWSIVERASPLGRIKVTAF